MAYLRLLGGASLEREGVALSGPEAQRHRLALLALLAAAHPHGIQREKLAGLLWPERQPERARNLLNQAIHHLRKALDSGAIVSSGMELRLDPDVLSCDVVEFREKLDAGHLAEAVEAYGGEFLDGFHLSGALDFQHWVDEERRRLADRFRTAVERLAEEAELREDAAAAVGWWRRRAADEPLNSRVALRLARALADWGDVAGALRQLRVHQRLLEDELGVGLPRELEDLEGALRRGSVQGPGPGGEEAGAPASRGAGGNVGEEPRRSDGSEEEAAARGNGWAGEMEEAYHEGAEVAEVSGGRETAAPPGGRAGERRKRSVWLGGGFVAAALVAGGLLHAGGSGTWPLGEDEGPSPSIVVLPFENLGSEEDAHFAAGITDELTAGLARVPDLSVIARTSALRYAGSGGVDIRAVGEELGVDYVVKGTLRWESPSGGGERVRVTPRLIRVPEGRHVWASTYERELDELVHLQAEITEAVLRELDPTLSLPGDGVAIRRSTDDLEAYDHYLQGNAYVARQFSEEAARAAIAQYERAVALDPGFLGAWRRLIQTRVWLGWVFDDDEEAPRAGEDLERLLELERDHPEVHLARGWYRYYGERQYAEAHEAFQEVLRSRPGDAEVLRVIGFLEQRLGYEERALAHMREALELSPRDAELAFGIGQMLLRMGRYEEAPAYYERAFSLAPDQDIGFLHSGYEQLHLALGDTAGARAVRERARELGGGAWMGGRAELYSEDFAGALDRVLDLRPSRPFELLAWYDNLADLHGRSGDDEGRLPYADSLVALGERIAPNQWDRPRVQAANAGWIYAGLGRIHRGETDRGLGLVRRGLRQEARFHDALVEPFVQGLAARAFVRAGREDEALDLLEAPGVVPGAVSVFDLRHDPDWSPLEDDPRFERLLGRD